MNPTTVVALALLFALGAALYSSVGHGGASAYIAAMALFSVAPETMKPTALALNLLVAGFSTWRYWNRGLTNWKLVLAFALTATPAAFTGGGIFLSPLIILNAWEEPRHTSGVVAAFILLNSAAGLAGNISSVGHLPHELPIFLGAAFGGALLGTWLGVERL